jgi:NDP-sugar pyrophosphorylase family protein
MAAGLGSRYGSLKQLDSLGPSGETILDYTIYDAIAAGFKKIVFIIKEELITEFKEVFFDKLKDKAEINYVFQSLENLPEGYSVPEGRTKPWGTAHAVLMTEAIINEPFAIVNADDYYGRSSFQLAYDHLCQMKNSVVSACLIGFELKNTLSQNGTVSRGICQVDHDGKLLEIIERTKIAKGNEHPYYEENGRITPLIGDEIVSMNLMGFTPAIFKLINEEFKKFLNNNMVTKDLKTEFYTPTVLDHVRQSGVNIPVLKSSEHWFGVTYKEDKKLVTNKLSELVLNKTYPSPIWS